MSSMKRAFCIIDTYFCKAHGAFGGSRRQYHGDLYICKLRDGIFRFKMKPCIQKTRTKPLIYGALFGFRAFMIEDLRLKTVYILRIFVKAITKLPTSSCACA